MIPGMHIIDQLETRSNEGAHIFVHGITSIVTKNVRMHIIIGDLLNLKC